jgi:hypothetical protein
MTAPGKVTVISRRDCRTDDEVYEVYKGGRWEGEVIIEEGVVKVRGFHYPHNDELCERRGGCFSPSGCGQVFDPDRFHPVVISVLKDLADTGGRWKRVTVILSPKSQTEEVIERELLRD